MSDQYEGREDRYMSSLPGRVRGLVDAIVDPHIAMTLRYAEAYAMMAAEKTVPMKVVIQAGRKRKMLMLEIPLVLIANIRPLDYDVGTGIKTRMSVSASEDDTLKVGSKAEFGIQAGWGGISASFKAEVTVDKTVQRKSDYSSTVEIDVKFISREPTEMVSKIGDILTEFVRAEINGMVARDELDDLPDAEEAAA